MDREQRNALVVENLPLVGYLVNDLFMRASHLNRDDLASAGALALIGAAESFDVTLGVPFGAFARRRIIGAFADDMRSNDWATRTARRRMRETLAVQDTLTASLGRTPSVDELASTLGVDRESVTEALADAARVVTSIDDTISDFIASPTETPEQTLLTTERSVYVRAAVDALPDNMRYIVEQVYFNERTVKDLAAELGSTHSAVSQHRAEAVRLLRDGLVAHYADGETAEETVHSRIAPSRRTAYLARLAEYAQAGVARQMPDIAQEISAAS